jgi:hypothetical protein
MRDAKELDQNLSTLSDLRAWLRTGTAYMEHPDGQEGTDNAVDALDAVMDHLIQLEREVVRRNEEARQLVVDLRQVCEELERLMGRTP